MSLSSLCESLCATGKTFVPALLEIGARGVAIMLLMWVTALAFRRASAAARHLVWFLGTLCLLILPLLTTILPGLHVLPSWNTAQARPMEPAPAVILPTPPRAEIRPSDTQLLPNYVPPHLAVGPAEQEVSPLPKLGTTEIATRAERVVHLSWQAWVLLVWLSGVVVCLAYLHFGCISLWLLHRRCSRMTDAESVELLRESCDALDFHRTVHLLSTPLRAMPMTWGIFRTSILLPAESTDWTPEQRRAVLLHELAHAKRLDCQTQLLAQFTCALHWFNPLVWFAQRRMQAEREQACDDRVLSAGALASAYAEQLLQIASRTSPLRFSAAAIAMARPSTLEGRLLAILDTSRNRRRVAITTAILITVTIGVASMVMAALRAKETGGSPADQTARHWAALHGWTEQQISPTSIESKLGGGWRNLPFTLDQAEEADAKACVTIAQKTRSSINGKTEFSDPTTRADLEGLLKRRPNYFYAEFLLAQWYRQNGDLKEAATLLDAAYRHAPVVIVQRFEFADGSPLADTTVQSFALECNRVQKGYLDPSLELLYTDLRTDADGCIYLPVYNTVYRANQQAYPDGYAVNWASLGWFETSQKVGLMPVAVVSPQAGDFVAAAAPGQPPTTSVTLSGDNKVDLLASSNYPDPKNIWWLPDGSLSPRQYQTGEPGISPWPAENGRRFIFRFAKPLDPDAHLMFRFSVPAKNLVHYTTVRSQDLDKPYVLFTVFPTHPKTVSIRLGEASGAWKSLAQFDPRTHASTGNLPPGFSFKDAQDKDNDFTQIIVAHPQADMELRVVAIDTAGKEHPTDMTWFSRSDTTIEDRFRFQQLPLAKIASFRLETRDYQWAEFGNIAISPGNARQHLRDVEQKYHAGLVTTLEYERASWDVKILEAEQNGDAIHAAKVRLDAATAIAKKVEQMYQVGLGTEADRNDAEGEVKLRQAEWDALAAPATTTNPATQPSHAASSTPPASATDSIPDAAPREKVAPAEQPSVKLWGQVVDDKTGQPIEHYTLQTGFVDAADPTKVGWGGEMSRSKWADGKFQDDIWISGGEPSWLRVLAPGYLPEPVTPQPIKGPPDRKDLIVRLKKAPELKGVVLDSAGNPVAGALVISAGMQSLTLEDGHAGDHYQGAQTTTGADGRFALAIAAGPGNWIVVSAATLDAYMVPVIQIPGELTIHLPQPASLTIHYEIEGSDDEADIRVELMTWEMPDWKDARVNIVHHIKCRQGGQASVTNLMPGAYDIVRERGLRIAGGGVFRGYLCDRSRQTLKPGGNPAVDFVRKTGQRISGKVTGLAGTNIPGATISVRTFGASGEPMNSKDAMLPIFDVVACGTDGVFKTSRLSPGKYTVLAEAYEPEHFEGSDNTGWRLPSLAASTELVVPETGDVSPVQLQLKPQ